MGCYDTLYGKCPHCGKDYDTQTKLFECLCEDFTIGDRISSPDESLKNYTFVAKDPCFECGEEVVVVIIDNRLTSLGKIRDYKPNFREVAYGGCIEEVEESPEGKET